jgi:GNAT superfamily N-acetyltransferase
MDSPAHATFYVKAGDTDCQLLARWAMDDTAEVAALLDLPQSSYDACLAEVSQYVDKCKCSNFNGFRSVYAYAPDGAQLGHLDVGWAKPHLYGTEVTGLGFLYVLPAHRSQGIASALLQAATDLANANGFPKTQVQVQVLLATRGRPITAFGWMQALVMSEANTAAMRFYTKHGFVDSGERKDTDFGPPACVMQRCVE